MTSNKKTLGLDDTLAKRWDLEPEYPEVLLRDVSHCEDLQAWLAQGPVVHSTLGVRVELNSAFPVYIAYLVVNDAYEHGDIALIRKYIGQASGKAMVLGAGMGVIAAALAQQTGQAVVVVDANSDVEHMVAKTAELNNVDLRFEHGAIVPGLFEGHIEFVVSEEFWASSLRQDTYKAAKTVQAPVLDVSKFLDVHVPQVLFVDIEGAEVGLFSTLPWTGVRQLFVEIHRPNMGTTKWASVISDIQSLGFKMVDASGLTCYFER